MISMNTIWVFPKIGVFQNGWFTMETLLKWMIWGGNPLFSETSIYIYIYMYIYRLYSTTSIFNFTFRKLGFDFFIPFME